MRKYSAALFLLLLVGCTSLLGNFEVTDVGPGGPDAATSETGTQCSICVNNGPCIDFTKDDLNCGGCGRVCNGGQVCEASACKCPPDLAFCNALCVKADRTHCGQACSACQADEVCNRECVVAPEPQFETLPPASPLGWFDQNNAPLSFKLKSTEIPGTLYECRTGPTGTFSATVPPWGPCDGGDGSTPVHTPVPDGTHPDGTYRTEFRYRHDSYRSAAIAHVYYVLHALDRVLTCPRVGQPADGPHFTDAQYFNAAQTFAQTQIFASAPFHVADTFDVPGGDRNGPFYIQGPWIKVPFKGAMTVTAVKGGTPAWPAPGVPFDYTLQERSLRHKYVLNGTRTMLLVRRRYVNPVKGDCVNRFTFGNVDSGDTNEEWGPIGVGRGPKVKDCEAMILNVHGVGLCMVPSPDGTVPIPAAIDERAPMSSGIYGNPGSGLASGTSGQSTLTVTVASFNLAWVNRWVQLPGAQFGTPTHWYKITGYTSSTSVTVTPAFTQTFSGQSWRYTASLQKIFAIPTAFGKLHEAPRRFVPPVGFPSQTTKCEDIASPYDNASCADGSPWLTYLPP